MPTVEQLVGDRAGVVRSFAQRRRISSATSTFSRAVRLPNASRRWNVRAMPSRARWCGRLRGDVDAVERDVPARRRLQPGDDVEQRRLAGAVRADQPGDAARLDVERSRRRRRAGRRTAPTTSTTSSSAIASRPRAPAATRDVVADAERAVDQQHVGLVNGRSSPSSPTSGSAFAALQLLVLLLGVLAPRQQPREAFADRHDRARRVLDDAEHGEAGREDRRARSTARCASSPGSMTVTSPKMPANSAPATMPTPPITRASTIGQAGEHLERAGRFERPVVHGEERAREAGHRRPTARTPRAWSRAC